MSNLHLKHLGPKRLIFLTKLFNLSLSASHIPAIWKKSLMVPLSKPGKDPSDSYPPNKVLGCAPPDNKEESSLPRVIRTSLSQLRSGFSKLLNSYNHRLRPSQTLAQSAREDLIPLHIYLNALQIPQNSFPRAFRPNLPLQPKFWG